MFSNACRVLSQCNTRLRLLYLLNKPKKLVYCLNKGLIPKSKRGKTPVLAVKGRHHANRRLKHIFRIASRFLCSCLSSHLICVCHCLLRCICEHLPVLHYWLLLKLLDRQTLFEGFVCDPKINRDGRPWEVEALDYQRDSIDLFKYHLPSVNQRIAVHIHALNKKIAKDPRVLVNILPTGSGFTIVTKLWLGSSGSLN